MILPRNVTDLKKSRYIIEGLEWILDRLIKITMKSAKQKKKKKKTIDGKNWQEYLNFVSPREIFRRR